MHSEGGIDERVSVLMSIYEREDPRYFAVALESIYTQTLPPDEVLIVQDGPLSDEHYKIIEEFRNTDSPVELRLIRNENKIGVARAWNMGIEAARNELIARMDTDDIAAKDRFERQIEEFRKKKELVLLGGQIEEFHSSPTENRSFRRVPTEGEAIHRYAKLRNPFNHMTVMYKKSPIGEAGGYEDLPGFVDYWLWVKLLNGGYECLNLPETLVYARTGNDLLSKRRGRSYIRNEIEMFRKMREIEFINGFEYLRMFALRILPRLLPKWALALVYKSTRRPAQTKEKTA